MTLARNADRPRPFTGPGAAAWFLLPLGLALGGASGCGAGSRLESVSGAVTLDGKNLQDGNIVFAPDGGDGLAVGLMVRDGRYSLPSPPGLAPGKYRVRIAATGSAAASPDTPPDVDMSKGAAARPQLPARYNEQTTLHADVTAGGSNVFDFELSGKPDSATTKAAGR